MVKKWIYGTTALSLVLNPLSVAYGVGGEDGFDNLPSTFCVRLKPFLMGKDWRILKSLSKGYRKKLKEIDGESIEEIQRESSSLINNESDSSSFISSSSSQFLQAELLGISASSTVIPHLLSKEQAEKDMRLQQAMSSLKDSLADPHVGPLAPDQLFQHCISIQMTKPQEKIYQDFLKAYSAWNEQREKAKAEILYEELSMSKKEASHFTKIIDAKPNTFLNHDDLPDYVLNGAELDRIESGQNEAVTDDFFDDLPPLVPIPPSHEGSTSSRQDSVFNPLSGSPAFWRESLQSKVSEPSEDPPTTVFHHLASDEQAESDIQLQKAIVALKDSLSDSHANLLTPDQLLKHCIKIQMTEPQAKAYQNFYRIFNEWKERQEEVQREPPHQNLSLKQRTSLELNREEKSDSSLLYPSYESSSPSVDFSREPIASHPESTSSSFVSAISGGLLKESTEEDHTTAKTTQLSEGKGSSSLSFFDLLHLPLEITYTRELKEGLERLKQKIIKATQAEEDVYSFARSTLEEDFKKNSSLAIYVDKPWQDILPPEKILQFRTKDLLTDLSLKPSNQCFSPLHTVLEKIRDLKLNLSSEIMPILGKAEKGYEIFLERFCKVSLAERHDLLEERAVLKGEGIGQYLIPAPIARDLLSKDLCGVAKKRDQEGGQSAVFHKDGVHFKLAESSVSDINPGMEWAAHSLSVLSLGPGYIPPSATLILQDVPFLALNPIFANSPEGKEAQLFFNEKVIFPDNPPSLEEFFRRYPRYQQYFQPSKTNGVVQASETSGEISLYEFLDKIKNEESSLTDLDPAFYSGMVFLSLLSNPTDMKDDNLRLIGNKLISIDNDRLFGNMIVKSTTGHLIEAKNALFLLSPLMEKSLHPSIKGKIQALDPDVFTLLWLGACDQQNQRYVSLHGKDKGWRIQFQKGTVLQIKQNLKDLQELMGSKQEIPTSHPKQETSEKTGIMGTEVSHQDLLIKISPIGAVFYQSFRKRFTDPHKAQDALWKAPFIEDFIQNTQFLENLSSFTEKPGAYEENRAQSPQQEAQSLLETIDLKRKTTPNIRLTLLTLAQDWLTWPETWNKSDILFTMAQDLLTSPLPIQLSITGKASMRSELLKTIIENPAFNPQQTDEKGNTLLHVWAKSSLPIDEETLIKWKAKEENLDALNQEGKSPFDSALENNHVSLLEFLLRQGGGKFYQELSLEKYYYTYAKDKNVEVWTAKGVWKKSSIGHLFKERKKADPHFAWVLKRTKFLYPMGPGEGAEIITYNQGRPKTETRYLPPKIKEKLWDSKGNFIAFHTNQNRMVGRVILKEDIIKSIPMLLKEIRNHSRLYFKRFPAFPGLSISISLLHEILFKEGFLPLTFAKIKEEPFLISSGIGELQWNEKDKKWEEVSNLHYILCKSPEQLNKLDLDETGKSLLMAMLVNPEDGKPSNYALGKMKNSKYRFVGIDEEQAFAPAISKPPEGVGNLTEVIVQMKSVLFCFDQLGSSLRPSLVATIKKWKPWNQLDTWIKALSQIQKEIDKLFPDKKKYFEDKESYLDIPFQKGDIGNLLRKLYLLITHVEENPNVTFFRLFYALEPFGARRYARVFSDLKARSVWERFKVLDLPIYDYNQPAIIKLSQLFAQESYLPSSVRSSHLLRSRNIPPFKNRKGESTFDPAMTGKELVEALKRVQGDALLKMKKKDVKQADTIGRLLEKAQIEEVVLNLRGYTPYEQQLVLQTMERLVLKSLSLFKSSAVNVDFIKKLKLENLEILELRHCPDLPDDLFSFIKPDPVKGFGFPHLKELDLSFNQNIRYLIGYRPFYQRFDVGGFYPVLAFPSLESLILNDCSRLEEINIAAPKLKKLNAARGNLKLIDIRAPLLERVNIEDNKELRDEGLMIQSSALETLNLQGCIKLSFIDFREEYPLIPLDLLKKENLREHNILTDLSNSLATNKLELKSKDLQKEAIQLIAHLTHLTTLDMRDNSIGDAEARIIAQKLTQLTSLNVSSNRIYETGVKAIIQGLPQLTSLDVSNNIIEDLGIEGITWGHPQLMSLNVGHNRGIGDREVRQITLDLPQLTSLNVENTDIGDWGAKIIMQNLTKLMNLDVGRNDIGVDTKTLLQQWQDSNPKLKVSY